MTRQATLLGRIGLALLPLLLPIRSARAEPPGVLVFAAASLKNALDDAAAGYPAARVTVSYAASGALARQIEAGAPAALFISADEDWMDELAAKGLIDAASRIDLLGNTLVLIAPSSRPVRFEFGHDRDLAALLGDGRLAIGDPQSVPAGHYAENALNALGLWPGVAAHLARAESVRAALALVDRGEAPLGIVYRTDAVADSAVRIVAEFPDGSHTPIRYPAALIAPVAAPARDFLAWLGSPAAAPFFARQGFIVPAR
ncbi:MAG: molybdate ABC transporter substrate-binding protein [Aliidongia sp.]